MRTFAINTLGCKINRYESQQIRQLLENLGLEQVDNSQKPDLAVINTCCVTHTASAKSRRYIRKAQKLSPGAIIVVSGCLPIAQLDELNGLGKNIRLIKHRQSTAAELSKIINGRNTIRTKKDPEIKHKNRSNQPKLPQLTAFKGQTRAFLKVQDGCDGLCTYCIIPKARPDVRSKATEDVLQEAQALVKAGHKEIVVTGVFLGAFGRDTVRRRKWPGSENHKLPDLLDRLAKIPNLERIRLSSLEPGDITEKLLDIVCANHNITPHLHLSLQSGSDNILRKMCRQYNADDFRKKVELIKLRLDRPAITTDIIVGFPGETNADFEQTMELAREVGFAKIHVFSYSARKGTAAAKLQDTVNSKVIKHRSERLRQLNTQLSCKFRQQFIGENATILLESDNGKLSGRCERYFMVNIEETEFQHKKGQLLNVRLTRNDENSVAAQRIN